ncbi:hypothetical protein AAC387_Pa11g0081 [Persea americana]
MKPSTKPNLVSSPPQPHLVSLAPWRPVSTLSERDCSCHCILSCTKPSSVFAALSAFFTKRGEERETCRVPNPSFHLFVRAVAGVECNV